MPAAPAIPLFFSWVCATKNRVRGRGFRAPVPAGRGGARMFSFQGRFVLFH